MGSSSTKPEAPVTEITESTGFHVIELHLPTMGMNVVSTFLMLCLFFVIGYLLFRCVRFCRGTLGTFPRQPDRGLSLPHYHVPATTTMPMLTWQPAPSPNFLDLPSPSQRFTDLPTSPTTHSATNRPSHRTQSTSDSNERHRF